MESEAWGNEGRNCFELNERVIRAAKFKDECLFLRLKSVQEVKGALKRGKYDIALRVRSVDFEEARQRRRSIRQANTTSP